jgi:hypothetical protein
MRHSQTQQTGPIQCSHLAHLGRKVPLGLLGRLDPRVLKARLALPDRLVLLVRPGNREPPDQLDPPALLEQPALLDQPDL